MIDAGVLVVDPSPKVANELGAVLKLVCTEVTFIIRKGAAVDAERRPAFLGRDRAEVVLAMIHGERRGGWLEGLDVAPNRVVFYCAGGGGGETSERDGVFWCNRGLNPVSTLEVAEAEELVSWALGSRTSLPRVLRPWRGRPTASTLCMACQAYLAALDLAGGSQVAPEDEVEEALVQMGWQRLLADWPVSLSQGRIANKSELVVQRDWWLELVAPSTHQPSARRVEELKKLLRQEKITMGPDTAVRSFLDALGGDDSIEAGTVARLYLELAPKLG